MWGGAAWLFLRAITSLAGVFALRSLDVGPTVGVIGYVPPPVMGLSEWIAGVWLRADALWYGAITEQGYVGTQGRLAFLPAFPLLSRVFLPLTGGNELYAGLLLANVCCVAGLVLLYRWISEFFLSSGGSQLLARARLSTKRAATPPEPPSGAAARAAVFGVALFPTSFFLVAPYGESLMMAAGAGALLAAQRGRAFAAGLAGGLAALSRPFGLLIAIPACLILTTRSRGEGGSVKSSPAPWWPALAGPLAAISGWAVWAALRTGDPLASVKVQAVWQRSLAFPPAVLFSAVRQWWRYRQTDLGPYFLIDLAAVMAGGACVVGALLYLRRRGINKAFQAGLIVYGASVLIGPLFVPFPPRPLLSLMRFVLALFPLAFVFHAVPSRAKIVLMVLSATGLFWLTALFVAARPIF